MRISPWIVVIGIALAIGYCASSGEIPDGKPEPIAETEFQHLRRCSRCRIMPYEWDEKTKWEAATECPGMQNAIAHYVKGSPIPR